MLLLYVKEDDSHIKKIHFKEGTDIPDNTIWLDLLDMTAEEERAVESFTHINIPSRSEMHEIELSSRLYEAHNSVFMTATLVARSESEQPESHAITFILVNNRLITIRYVESQPFLLFSLRSEKIAPSQASGSSFFVGLLESIIDRAADIIEHIDLNLDMLTSVIFFAPKHKSAPKRDLEKTLEAVGLNGDLISRMRESLVTLNRMMNYVQQSLESFQSGELLHRLKTVSKDSLALSDHLGFLSTKINFLLDATLGMINIEQNNVIKIFSIAAVVLLPPTLIATIYGMNFRIIPELHWALGYPFALCLMLVSAIAPYLYFKKKKWL